MAPGLITFGFEYRMGYLVDLCADPLENIGRAVNHGVEQFHKHGFTARPRWTHSTEFVSNDCERARLVVTHGDEPMSRQNEGNGRRLRGISVGLAHQGRGHVARAVLDIES